MFSMVLINYKIYPQVYTYESIIFEIYAVKFFHPYSNRKSVVDRSINKNLNFSYRALVYI